MKHLPKIGLALFLLGFAFACKQADHEAEAKMEITNPSAPAISSNAAVEPKNSTRKFVRTADIKFKVKDVAKSTYTIENSIAKHGGFVTFTDLKSNINQKTETKISRDSILETIKYTVDNTITFRIPNTQLDTVLKSLVKEINFLDSRLIKADDVSLQLLSNKLAQKRIKNSQERLEKGIDNKGKKLDNIVDAENNALQKATESDTALLNNLTLEDQVNFSTVTLYLYQRETTKQEVIANEKSINTYRQNIGLQIWDSLQSGWYILEEIIAFVLQLWSVILIGFVGFLVYKKFLKK